MAICVSCSANHSAIILVTDKQEVRRDKVLGSVIVLVLIVSRGVVLGFIEVVVFLREYRLIGIMALSFDFISIMYTQVTPE